MRKFSNNSSGFADGKRVPVSTGHDRESVEFDYDGADPVVREILARAELDAQKRACAAVSSVLAVVLDAERPKLVASQIAAGVGMFLLEGVSEQVLADRFGISRQAFQQGKKRLMKELDLKRPTRAMKRNPKVYSGTNYRPPKKEYFSNEKVP